MAMKRSERAPYICGESRFRRIVVGVGSSNGTTSTDGVVGERNTSTTGTGGVVGGSGTTTSTSTGGVGVHTRGRWYGHR